MKLFEQPECFGFHFYLSMIILALVCVSFVVVEGSAYAKSARPELVVLHTMDNCGPCDALKAALKHRGVDVTVDYVTTTPLADSYPTCVYSDGKIDNGLKLSFGLARWPEGPITIIHYKGN